MKSGLKPSVVPQSGNFDRWKNSPAGQSALGFKRVTGPKPNGNPELQSVRQSRLTGK